MKWRKYSRKKWMNMTADLILHEQCTFVHLAEWPEDWQLGMRAGEAGDMRRVRELEQAAGRVARAGTAGLGRSCARCAGVGRAFAAVWVLCT